MYYMYRGDNMRLLIVEDEVRLSDALSAIFTKEKFDCDASYDGIDGLDNALTGIYDLIILDVMLPKMDGYDVLKRLRDSKIDTPVLMLTARDDIQDKVKGLDIGADDYLTKPFQTEELLARVRAICRRKGELVYDNLLTYDDLTLNLATYELSCGNNSIKLAPKEFNIMELLMRYKNNIVSKEALIEKIWGYDSDAEYNNAEVYISFIRKKISHVNSRVKIRTVRGVGYNMEVETP